MLAERNSGKAWEFSRIFLTDATLSEEIENGERSSLTIALL